jgi:hypothetical protein
MLKVIFLSIILAVSGCATIIDSSRQEVNLTPIPAKDLSNKSVTVCKLKNEEGNWNTNIDILSTETVNVHRDGNSLDVVCTNSDQIGETQVIPDFRAAYLLGDFILGYCIFSCSVDAYTNAFYAYPNNITVPMINK